MIVPRTYQEPSVCGLVQQNDRDIFQAHWNYSEAFPNIKKSVCQMCFLRYCGSHLQITLVLVTVRAISSLHQVQACSQVSAK